ncbi:hypothetical protein BCR34DRAFT_647475 [Clohesyomyces aquaticus]|uniref:Uncharacterized protein n=1 Tax=Clohesyomyces aquaticus TaxID=1231657 RepID=A0A1Y1ZUF5_9PLEO|nr:hypothetical protein BCR34DRAFT_647475 [Clohesyomyces aquaticus]
MDRCQRRSSGQMKGWEGRNGLTYSNVEKAAAKATNGLAGAPDLRPPTSHLIPSLPEGDQLPPEVLLRHQGATAPGDLACCQSSVVAGPQATVVAAGSGQLAEAYGTGAGGGRQRRRDTPTGVPAAAAANRAKVVGGSGGRDDVGGAVGESAANHLVAAVVVVVVAAAVVAAAVVAAAVVAIVAVAVVNCGRGHAGATTCAKGVNTLAATRYTDRSQSKRTAYLTQIKQTQADR